MFVVLTAFYLLAYFGRASAAVMAKGLTTVFHLYAQRLGALAAGWRIGSGLARLLPQPGNLSSLGGRIEPFFRVCPAV